MPLYRVTRKPDAPAPQAGARTLVDIKYPGAPAQLSAYLQKYRLIDAPAHYTVANIDSWPDTKPLIIMQHPGGHGGGAAAPTGGGTPAVVQPRAEEMTHRLMQKPKNGEEEPMPDVEPADSGLGGFVSDVPGAPALEGEGASDELVVDGTAMEMGY